MVLHGNHTTQNETLEEPPWLEPLLGGANTFVLFMLMLGLGCSIQFQQFKYKLKHPKSIALGMFCQFVAMPFVSWALANALKMNPISGAALCIIGTCPGGALSNMLSYVLRTDLTLSVAMTTASSVMAFVMMPINFKLYLDVLGVGGGSEKKLTTEELNLDWGKILSSTVIVVAGTLCGMVLNKKVPKLARKLETFGIISGVGTLMISSAQFKRSGARWKDVDANIAVAAVILSILGGAFGIILSSLLKIKRSSRVAIGFESSLQNGLLGLAIIQISISKTEGDTLSRAIVVPLVYTMVSSCVNIFAGLGFWKFGWTGASPKATPLKDFHSDWKETGSIRKAVTLSHERLKSLHIKDQEIERKAYEENPPNFSLSIRSKVSPKSSSGSKSSSALKIRRLSNEPKNPRIGSAPIRLSLPPVKVHPSEMAKLNAKSLGNTALR